MKKVWIASFILLAACSGEDSGNVNGETNEISSVVNPNDPVTTGDDKYQEAANKSSNAGEVKDVELTSIEYMEEKHDFGKVFYPSENLYTFKFKNTGTAPLIIEDARASCGCTVPNKPEEPIMPGETGELDVIFRPKEGQIGQPVTKRITVTANTNPRETYLEISANVLKAM